MVCFIHNTIKSKNESPSTEHKSHTQKWASVNLPLSKPVPHRCADRKGRAPAVLHRCCTVDDKRTGRHRSLLVMAARWPEASLSAKLSWWTLLSDALLMTCETASNATCVPSKHNWVMCDSKQCHTCQPYYVLPQNSVMVYFHPFFQHCPHSKH